MTEPPIVTEAEESNEALAICLAGIRQFIIQPPNAQVFSLLMLRNNFGRLRNIKFDAKSEDLSEYSFDVEHTSGRSYRFKCNPGAIVFLQLVQIFGQTVFVNLTDGVPYLKAFGRFDKSPGIVVARIITGALAADPDDPDHPVKGEVVSYKNKDTTDLTARNLELSEPVHGRAKAGIAEVVSKALSYAGATSDSLFPGDVTAKNKAAKELLHLSMGYLESESST